MYAARWGHPSLVTLLLERGADRGIKCTGAYYIGKTALDIARDKGHAEVVALLEGWCWFWSPRTHVALPPAGRRRAVFVCLALSRWGLPSLCWEAVLRACTYHELADE